MVSTEQGKAGTLPYEIEFDNDYENNRATPSFKVRVQVDGEWVEIDATGMAEQFAAALR